VNRISKINIIKQFTTKDDGITYGVYDVTFNNKQEIFIRNGDSVGAIRFGWHEPVNKCIGEIKNDIKQEFFEYLKIK